MVLHIPGVHTCRLLPTATTVQGVNSSFIPTENGDERFDCACAVVTTTGLNLSLPWLDAGEQGSSGAGIIPVSPCPSGLSKYQEVWPASSSFQLPRSISHGVIRTVAGSDVLKKGLFGLVFPNQVACISNQRGRFQFYTHEMQLESWNEIDWATKLRRPWRPLACNSTTWISPSKAKRANRLRPPR